MIEVTGNIWDRPCDWLCITTNGEVKKDGRAVMGKGIAKEALDRYDNIDLELADKINRYGNTVQRIYPGFNVYRRFVIGVKHDRILSFPTKHKWRDKSDIELIKLSAEQLYFYWLEYTKLHGKSVRVCLPRPGCGNGGLMWEEVRDVISPILKSDNFVIVDLK